MSRRTKAEIIAPGSAPATFDLVEEIVREHEAAEAAATEAIRHAAACGRALIRLKEELPHGEYIPFIESNLPITRQTAAGYKRIAEAIDSGELQMEGPPSISKALKQLAVPKADDDRVGGEAAPFPPEVMAAVDEVDKLVAGRRLDDLDPKESWDLEEKLSELRAQIQAALTPFERYWLKHKGPIGADRLADIQEVCEIAGMRAFIEAVGDDKYVWVGFAPAAPGGGFENPLSYHPGWAKYCRSVLGDGVTVATEELMPANDRVTEGIL